MRERLVELICRDSPSLVWIALPCNTFESSAWTAYVRRVFQKFHGTAVAPKTLRSSFITWLRDSTSAPEILKSAVPRLVEEAPRIGELLTREMGKPKPQGVGEASYCAAGITDEVDAVIEALAD